MWVRVTAAVLIAGCGCLASLPAQALDKEAYCVDYANTAVKAQRDNLRLKCGHTGARYDLNWQQHYGWCQLVGREATAREASARGKAMRACRR